MDRRNQPDALFRRRGNRRVTTKRPMLFTVPSAQMRSPIPQIQRSIKKKKRVTPPADTANASRLEKARASSRTPAAAAATPADLSQFSASSAAPSSAGSSRSSMQTPNISIASSVPRGSAGPSSKKRQQQPSSHKAAAGALPLRASTPSGSIKRTGKAKSTGPRVLSVGRGRGRRPVQRTPQTTSSHPGPGSKKSLGSAKASAKKTTPAAKPAAKPASQKSARASSNTSSKRKRQPASSARAPKGSAARKNAAPKTAKPKQAAKRRKRKGGADDDDDDEIRVVHIRPIGNQPRRATTLTDLDIAIDVIEQTAREQQVRVDSRSVQRAMTDFMHECESILMDNVEMIEEQRVLQKALRAAESRKRRLRQELLDVQRARMQMATKLQAAKAEYRLQEQHRKDADAAHSLLCDIDAWNASSKQPAKKQQAVSHQSVCASLDACVHSHAHLQAANDQIERFLNSLE